MISLEKLKILAHTQKLPKTVGYLGKLIVAKGFKKLPKVQKIAKSGHTVSHSLNLFYTYRLSSVSLPSSVTILGDFLQFLVIWFLSKVVAQMHGDFWAKVKSSTLHV